MRLHGVCIREDKFSLFYFLASYLTGERQRGRDFLHGQVPDARGERPAACRAAAQLLSALVTYQVSGLALQDRRQHVVEAHGTLKQRCELRRLAR